MEQLDYMLHREEYEKDVYERQQAYRKLEARWPKWIKYSSWVIWGVFLLLGFLFHSSAMGLMLGFVIGGGISLGYEALCRLIYAKKHGITDIRGKETIRALAREQTARKEAREREAILRAEAEAAAAAEEAEQTTEEPAE